MDHIKILKRAFNITVNYRVLWIFGILLALTAGGGGGGNGGGSGSSSSGSGSHPYGGNLPNFPFNPSNPFGQLAPDVLNMIAGVAIGLACVILLLVVIGTIVRFVSETALIRMVDRHENSGEKLTFREGWHLGWSQAAWRMFLTDLLVGLTFLVAFLVAILIAAAPFLVWLTKSVPLQVLGSVIGAGLLLLVIFAAILIGLVLGIVMLFARRAIALEDLGVIEALRRGFAVAKGRAMDVFLMAIMMFGIGLVWSLLMIPVFIALVLAAALIGGLPALLVGGITGLFTQGATPWIVAAIVGAPIALLVLIIPGLIINGWMQVFTSSTWTLTYRETVALENTNGNDKPAAPEAAPAAA